MVIALHLGAHKTATTYIQSALELSRDKLHEADISYVPLPELRRAVTERLGFARPKLRSAVDRLLKDHGGCKRLILSDENIIGGLKPSARFGFYARRRRRLTKLLNKLGQHDFQIFFATRSYDEFMSAMYCEYIRHRPFIEAETYLGNFAYKAFNWAEIVGTFVRLVGAEKIYLWRYEDFPVLQDQVFAALIDAPAELVQKPAGRVRESLSLAAVQSLASLKPPRDADEARARANAAATAYPKTPDNPSFSAFNRVTSQALRAQYESDLARLHQDFPEIRFLSPLNETATA